MKCFNPLASNQDQRKRNKCGSPFYLNELSCWYSVILRTVVVWMSCGPGELPVFEVGKSDKWKHDNYVCHAEFVGIYVLGWASPLDWCMTACVCWLRHWISICRVGRASWQNSVIKLRLRRLGTSANVMHMPSSVLVPPDYCEELGKYLGKLFTLGWIFCVNACLTPN